MLRCNQWHRWCPSGTLRRPPKQYARIAAENRRLSRCPIGHSQAEISTASENKTIRAWTLRQPSTDGCSRHAERCRTRQAGYKSEQVSAAVSEEALQLEEWQTRPLMQEKRYCGAPSRQARCPTPRERRANSAQTQLRMSSQHPFLP